jgi:hypothetical protein
MHLPHEYSPNFKLYESFDSQIVVYVITGECNEAQIYSTVVWTGNGREGTAA